MPNKVCLPLEFFALFDIKYSKLLLCSLDFLMGEHADGMNYIENCISTRASIVKVLRLIVLQSLCQGGLLEKDYESIRSGILSVRIV